MKVIRHIGSGAFVLGLFTAIFVGMPWYMMVADDPVVPWWLQIAVFCLLGGILLVLATLAIEQWAHKASGEGTLPAESDRTVLLLNSMYCPGEKSPRFSVWSRDTWYLPYGLAKTYPPLSG